MSSKGQHVQDNSVLERRLRPIYDWLDIGNNKKALQECEKVLKKTPNLQCVKALKALTLNRLGKEPEAVAIIEVLTAENPVDDATLQALTLCFRELQQPERVCKLYETAVKLDQNNEELYTHLFMSYVRIFDFQAQKQTAMVLYKITEKIPYHSWGVMSIILQATRGQDSRDVNKRKVLLTLAQRMVEKNIAEKKLDSEPEVQLYLVVLALQDKYREVLDILDGPLGTKLTYSNPPQNRLKYLRPLKMWHEINLLCKGILVDSVDRWDIWKEYVGSTFSLMDHKPEETNNHGNHVATENDIETVDDTSEKCHEFICRIVENGSDNGYLMRGPYLARFELCGKLMERGVDPVDVLGEIIELFIEYFRKFGHKPCCVSDLRIYLGLLDAEKKSELASRLVKDVGISSTSVPQSEQQMQRHLCALQLSRLCGAHRNLSEDHLRALVTAFSLHYQHGYQTYGTNLLPTDLGPSDPYALLAAHVLYDLAKREDNCDPIVAALVLIETLLKNSPSNFHAKLLGVRLYHTIGGTIGAHNMYSGLDMKHLQLDSLGFIHCARLPTTGLFSLYSNLCDVTCKFFSTNYKDIADFIALSYKYGSFLKLDEFMDFRERLYNSLHYNTVAVDKFILRLVECTNLSSIYNMNITPDDPKFEWDLLRDNHDLSVYVTWDPERVQGPTEESDDVKLMFEQNVNFLKLRTFVLWSLTAAINVVKSSDVYRRKHINNLVQFLTDWDNLLAEIRKKNYSIKQQDHLALPLPSRLHVAMTSPHIEILGGCFKILLRSAIGNDYFDDLLSELEDTLEGLHKRLTDVTTDETKQKNLIHRRETMELLVNSIEILSVSCVVCLLCNDVSRPVRKGKRRLEDRREWLARFVTDLKTHLGYLEKTVKNWSKLSVLSDLPRMFDSLSLNDDGRNVYENIVNSYATGSREIQDIIKIKVKMLNSIVA